MLAILPFFFFFNDTATTEIYPLSLHDALPISAHARWLGGRHARIHVAGAGGRSLGRCAQRRVDRKSTRLNSSHQIISYAVFCLKKKNDIDEDGHALLAGSFATAHYPVLNKLHC